MAGSRSSSVNFRQKLSLRSRSVQSNPQSYTTIWEDDDFTSFIDEEEVMGGSRYASEVPEKTLRKTKSSLSLRTSKTMESLKERAQSVLGKERNPKIIEDSMTSKHNPRVMYGQPPKGIEKIVQSSKTLTNVANTIKSFAPRQKEPAAHRVWGDLSNDEWEPFPLHANANHKILSLDLWTHDQCTAQREHTLVALTTRELQSLQGKAVAGLITSKVPYTVPPPSKAASEAGDQSEEDSEFGFEKDYDRFSIPSYSNDSGEHRHIQKDLRKTLGHFTGFHIAASGTDIAFECGVNTSDYYGIPLIEYDPKSHTELGRLLGFDTRYMPDPDTISVASMDSDSSDVDGGQPTWLRQPRSQVPAQALLLYYLYQGKSIDDVVQRLGSLDIAFLYENDSRWWNDMRVPELQQLNFKIAEKVRGAAQADEQWWEKDFDRNGLRIPEVLRTIQTRMRETEVRQLAKKSVENYFYWRLKGEIVHRDIKFGQPLKKGEY